LVSHCNDLVNIACARPDSRGLPHGLKLLHSGCDAPLPILLSIPCTRRIDRCVRPFRSLGVAAAPHRHVVVLFVNDSVRLVAVGLELAATSAAERARWTS
jgi:hypothetical protein